MDPISQFQAYVPAIDITSLLPFMALLLGAIACLVGDALTDKYGSRRLLPVITLASLLASTGMFFVAVLPTLPFIEGAFRSDEFGQLGALVILLSAIVMTMLSPKLIEKRNLPSGEYYTLILFATFGMVTLSVANELLTAFVCLEIMSLSLYVLAGIDRRSGKATEAAFKYFMLGAFASAFLVMGIAFLYGATRTTYLHEMASIFSANAIEVAVKLDRPAGAFLAVEKVATLNPLWIFTGFAFVFVGICFKLALAPFHMYAPDLYEGANTPTAMFIATGSKVAAVAFLVHVIEPLSLWQPYAQGAVFIVGFAAVASMIWGNLAALVQTNVKRMLAYSSVAHTGYTVVGALVLLGLPATGLMGGELQDAQSQIRLAMVFYLAGYTLMNIVAFGLAQYIGGEGHMAAYRGLASRQPVAALGMAIAMFSLLGIPPTVGFMGKFYVFKEAVQHGFVTIAVIGVLASVISAFYYLNLVVTMFMRDESDPAAAEIKLAGVGVAGLRTGMSMAAIGVAAALVFVFGVLPTLFLALDAFLSVR